MSRRLDGTLALAIALAVSCTPISSLSPRIAGGEGRGEGGSTAHVRLLSINDFHGQLVPGKVLFGRPVGSAGVLGAWLMSARTGAEGRTVLVHAGDLVGASPPASALLEDEPSISFLNRFADEACRYAGPRVPARLPLSSEAGEGAGGWGFIVDPDFPRPEAEPRFQAWLDPDCDVVGTVGNHEFDEGTAELLRLLAGGNHPRGPFLETSWRGARYPTLAANVVDRFTGRTILPTFVVKRVNGVRVGFIGVVTRQVPGLVEASGVAGLEFQDEAEAVNRYAAVLKASGVRAIVVLLHQGGDQQPYRGPTREGAAVDGEVVGLVARFDPEVDVVIAGHSHAFVNARLPLRSDPPAAPGSAGSALVVEAFSAGAAFGRVDLEVDRRSGDVVSAQAEVQGAFADEGPGKEPDPEAAAIEAAAEARVAPLVKRVICTAAEPLRRAVDRAGESRLGDLVADAHRAAVPGAQVSFTNRGGLRADLPAGPVSWGELFAAQPFGNDLVAMTLTGAQILALLEQQWSGDRAQILPASGLSYAWSASRPRGSKVSDVRVGGIPIDRAAPYRVVVSGFLASGGDGFGVLREGIDRAVAGNDLDALVAYLGSLPQPVKPPGGERIRALP